jgi:hypothetical protein
MFTTLQREAPASAACQTVERLVRDYFSLGLEAEVAVQNRPTTLPGCPPWETLIDFWLDQADGSTQRHHCKVFKPAHEVQTADLPPVWMKAALAVPAHYVCDCC